MCVKEFAALAGWRVEIVATDLSQEVLEKSKAGIYSQFEVQRGLPIQLLVKYFKQIGELWQLNADIRGMVQHRQLNLLQDFSHLGTFDLIFCRNVLIYFDQDTKVGIFERLSRMRRTRWRAGAGGGRIRGRTIRRLQALSGTARALPSERSPRATRRCRGDAAAGRCGRDALRRCSSPSLHALLRVAGRGRGWGALQQIRSQTNAPIDPPPRPLPTASREGGEERRIAFK